MGEVVMRKIILTFLLLLPIFVMNIEAKTFKENDVIEEKKDEKDKCSSVGGMRDVENENSCNGENRKEKCEKKETGEIDADA